MSMCFAMIPSYCSDLLRTPAVLKLGSLVVSGSGARAGLFAKRIKTRGLAEGLQVLKVPMPKLTNKRFNRGLNSYDYHHRFRLKGRCQRPTANSVIECFCDMKRT